MTDVERKDYEKSMERANTRYLLLLECLNRIEKGCSYPEDNVQRAIRDIAREALAKCKTI